MHLWTLLLMSLVANSGIVQAKRIIYKWKITYVHANPDCLFPRQVVGVNGAWPPPTIHASLNDTLVIHVHNTLDIPTALHSHGQFQNGTVWMDGAVHVTQCEIPPNYNFTYEFNITQTGTYWIHSHYMGQYTDGLRSPMILHHPIEPYPYDYDLVVPISDWYHNSSKHNLGIFMNVNNPKGAEPVPDSGLIMDTVNPNITFLPGKRYRLRFLNMSAFSSFFISIDGHTLDIIEVDGVDTQMKTVKNFYLTAAQRISVLIIAKNSTDTNYLLHADMNTDMFDTLPPSLNTNLTANILYDATHHYFAPSEDVGMNSDFDDIDLPPLHKTDAVEPDQQVNLTFKFEVMKDGINRGMFNGISYLPPKVPSLSTLMSLVKHFKHPTSYGPYTQPIFLEHLHMVELVLNNLDTGAHPFHLHGHNFQIVARGKGVFSGNRSQVQWKNINPTIRDTVIVPAGGYTILRFRADNPGVWLFHCHIEWHMESGLAATFIEAPTVARQRMVLPTNMGDLCMEGGHRASGDSNGKRNSYLDGNPVDIFSKSNGVDYTGKIALTSCILSAVIGIVSIILYSVSNPEKELRAIANVKI
ncbi:multicopper oxidase-domain-containing protein [Spinellus fusiger]|nr:multicopper oxidase-domain-containing protein [Spinellus fusiger]